MPKICSLCQNVVTQVPNLVCGHFVCPRCYVGIKMADSKATCPHCPRVLKRRGR